MANPNLYPNKKEFIQVLLSNKYKFIDKTTTLTSMGSCFATNIGRYFIENGFNYLIKEKLTKNVSKQGLNPYIAASAKWDFVYNTSVMRQIFEYSFLNNWMPKERWWKKDDLEVIDPYRRGAFYKTAHADDEFIKHKNASKEALSEADVIILTLGLTELWRNKIDKKVFYQVPPKSVLDFNKHEFYQQTVSDIMFDLETIYSILKYNNSKVKIIITVSPVPFNASFRKNVDVVSANMTSKAKLKVAADTFVSDYPDVFYFPSYEFVMMNQRYPFVEDGRHIHPSVVSEVMELFLAMFVKDDI